MSIVTLSQKSKMLGDIITMLIIWLFALMLLGGILMSIKVNGLAKLTLLDFPGRTAATIFFAGCNMRCPFCHNASLVVDMAGAEQIDESELRAFFAKRQGLLDGIDPVFFPHPAVCTFIAQIVQSGIR